MKTYKITSTMEAKEIIEMIENAREEGIKEGLEKIYKWINAIDLDISFQSPSLQEARYYINTKLEEFVQQELKKLNDTTNNN